MGILLLFFVFLIWLNIRKIRKIHVNYAKQDGVLPRSLIGQILDIIGDYHEERVQSAKQRKKNRVSASKNQEDDSEVEND